MTKPLILLFLALCALVPALGRAQATKVTSLSNIPKVLDLSFSRMEWDSLDIIRLYTQDGRSHELVCSFNPWYGESRSRIEYKNQYRIRVAQFSMDDHACLKLFNFGKIAFEGVNSEHPINISIDLIQNHITNIELPALDFYEKAPNLEVKGQPANLKF